MPQQFVLENQFGEVSINYVLSNLLPLENNVVIFSGATAPINGTTGDNIAGPGSLYVARDTGLLYQQTGLITNPTWVSAGSGSTATLLTGFVSGAGTVSAADTVLQGFNKVVGNQALLQNGTFTPTLQTLSAAGAINTTSMETLVNNATGGTFAMTLAAPSSQDGQIKIIKLGTATTNGMTMAMTNIKGPGFCTLSGTTTLTFTTTGQCAVLMAVGSKWMLIGGDAVAS